MDRKEIVKALGEHFKVKPKYLGVPSFAYEIETEEEMFRVDREGRIITKAGEEVKIEEILNTEDKELDSEETTRVEIVIPLEDHNLNTLKTLINMIYSRQVLIKNAFELEENILETEVLESIDETDSLEEFKSRLQSNNIKIENRNIIFTIDTGLVRSATLFFGLLNEKSKELKYASAKVIETDNEKYSFRTWLMRLGMIGDEYKETRKELLKNLSGNSAFRKTKVEDSHE